MILIYFENGLFLFVTPNFVKRRGTKSNKSFDEVWCLQHNETNEITAMNKLVFILGKTGLDNLKRKLSDLIPVVGSGGTATIKNDLNTPLPPQS